MLSTAQALRQWEGVLNLLSQVKQFVATHPQQPIPAGLSGQLGNSMLDTATKELASPHATWKKLLQSKVPGKVLTACSASSELVYDHSPVVVAATGMLSAAAYLVRAAPGPNSSSSSPGSSKLVSMMQEQLQQSGLLEQLPSLFEDSTITLDAHISQGEFSENAGKLTFLYAKSLFEILDGVHKLQPSFLTAHAAGRKCCAPAMQLGLLSLQYISKAVAQGGPQDWLQVWLSLAWDGAMTVAQETLLLLVKTLPKSPVVSNRHHHGSRFCL